MTDTERFQYRNRVREQLQSWVLGTSFHNKVDNECCPDFSCCHPHLFDKDLDSRRNRMEDTVKRWNN